MPQLQGAPQQPPAPAPAAPGIIDPPSGAEGGGGGGGGRVMADSVAKLFQHFNQINSGPPHAAPPPSQHAPQPHAPRHGTFQQHPHPQADHGFGHGGAGLHHSHSQNFDRPSEHSSSQRGGGLDSPTQTQNQHGRSPHQRMRKTHSEPNMPVPDDSSRGQSHSSHSNHHRGHSSSHAGDQRIKRETAVTAVLFGYVGTRYHGLQKHDNVPTIEKDLESALVKAGAIVYAQVRKGPTTPRVSQHTIPCE
jgi:hypothetical protein